MPFGGVLFADKENGTIAQWGNAESPVPFGGVLFADLASENGYTVKSTVTSAFRRSAVRGP